MIDGQRSTVDYWQERNPSYLNYQLRERPPTWRVPGTGCPVFWDRSPWFVQHGAEPWNERDAWMLGAVEHYARYVNRLISFRYDDYEGWGCSKFPMFGIYISNGHPCLVSRYEGFTMMPIIENVSHVRVIG